MYFSSLRMLNRKVVCSLILIASSTVKSYARFKLTTNSPADFPPSASPVTWSRKKALKSLKNVTSPPNPIGYLFSLFREKWNRKHLLISANQDWFPSRSVFSRQSHLLNNPKLFGLKSIYLVNGCKKRNGNKEKARLMVPPMINWESVSLAEVSDMLLCSWRLIQQSKTSGYNQQLLDAGMTCRSIYPKMKVIFKKSRTSFTKDNNFAHINHGFAWSKWTFLSIISTAFPNGDFHLQVR